MSVSVTSYQKTSRGRKLWRNVCKNRWFYLCILPAFLTLLVFHYFPIYGVQLAFRNFKFKRGIMGSEWVGTYYFQRLFNSPDFYRLLRNSLTISLLKLVTGFVSTIVLALLFNEVPNAKFKRGVQTVSYLPHFISWVVLGGILREMLSPGRGVLNYIIQFFGGESIHFLASTDHFIGVLIISNIWQGVGWGTIVYLAAISAIDQEQYESAYIDGASRVQTVLHITLPSIMPTIVTLVTLSLGGIMSAGFDQIFNLYNSAVYEVADIIDTYVYRLGLEKMEYSYSTAVGLFKSVIGFILVIISNMSVKLITKGEYRIW